MASEVYSLIQGAHLAILNIALMTCAVAIDEEEPIPVVEVNVILRDVIVVSVNEIRRIRCPFICDVRIGGPKKRGSSDGTIVKDSLWGVAVAPTASIKENYRLV